MRRCLASTFSQLAGDWIVFHAFLIGHEMPLAFKRPLGGENRPFPRSQLLTPSRLESSMRVEKNRTNSKKSKLLTPYSTAIRSLDRLVRLAELHGRARRLQAAEAMPAMRSISSVDRHQCHPTQAAP
jgi:hypothetical protein